MTIFTMSSWCWATTTIRTRLAPIVAGRGSAIFLHVAREAYAPTEGCIALALNDLLNLLGSAEVGAVVEVEPI